MFKSYYPYEYADSVFDIDYDKLYSKGYRGLIFDVDNTLVHHGDDSTPEVDRLFYNIKKTGFRTVILSDNDEKRILRFLENIDSPYVCEAGKPDTEGYIKALEILEMDRSQVLVIGDQIFKDILGANRSGIGSILVKFIRLESETRIGKRRQLEKVILWFYKRNRKYRHRLGDVLKKCSDGKEVK